MFFETIFVVIIAYIVVNILFPKREVIKKPKYGYDPKADPMSSRRLKRILLKNAKYKYRKQKKEEKAYWKQVRANGRAKR